MMKYLLDTNVVIRILKKGSDGGKQAAERIRALPASQVVLCSIVEAELFLGAEKYETPPARRAALQAFFRPFAVLPFCSLCVPAYAAARHGLEIGGMLIGAHDLMISAIALTHGLTVITDNTAEFGRIPGLNVENWTR